jgi:hypothetical protein
VHLGLDQVETALLILTLFISGLTFGGARTNVLQGVVPCCYSSSMSR